MIAVPGHRARQESFFLSVVTPINESDCASRDPQTLSTKGVKSCQRCQAVCQGRKKGKGARKRRSEDDNKRKKTECVSVAGNVFSYLCAAASWCAATTLKVLLSAKWLMIQTPTNCHAILFPMRPCSLPHLLPHGSVTSVEQ